MEDFNILHEIQHLVDEEHQLIKREEEGKLEDDQRERIRDVQVKLDQCWDLLRQRRARRRAGLNPNDAQVRDPNIVEHYLQ